MFHMFHVVPPLIQGFFVQEALRAVLFSCLFVLTPFLLQQTIRSLGNTRLIALKTDLGVVEELLPFCFS